MPHPSRSRQSPPLLALGTAIRTLRAAKGLSQEELALAAEVDRSYLGRIERGDNNVALLTLLKIAKALGVTTSKLMHTAKL